METASPDKLSRAPFYYQAQYENPVRVITVSFEAMIQLAQSVTVDDGKLIFIHSTGRLFHTGQQATCTGARGAQYVGSNVLTQLVAARFMQPDQQDRLKMLLDTSIRLLCKTPAPIAAVIKGRSWSLALGDWLYELYPRTKNLYLYREAKSWIKPNLNAFVNDVERTPEELRQFDIETRSWMQLVVPSIARYNAKWHLSLTGLISQMWLDHMECYMDLHQAGIEMLAISCRSWKLDPRRMALSMLVYCGCCPDDGPTIEKTLTKDSQAGSAVSEDTVKRKTTTSQIFNLSEINRHLQSHANIQTADFEVPNTRKL